MRTDRATLTGVLALTFAVLPAVAAAQTVDEESSAPSHWTAVETSGPNFAVPDAGIDLYPWGYRQTMGLTFTSESDDPRASGDIDMVYVIDWSDEYDLGRGIGLARLVNEDGSFEGPVNVVYYPDGSEFRMALMEGKGGYEGLTYSMTNYLDPSGKGQSQGLIWEGEAPPLPDADALPE